ncbi:MAG: dienelactone hydrolase family protein [Pirellulaceae bacterium]|nr:dienelactone hydrolase family protein [Pirellulaceae bacterium]
MVQRVFGILAFSWCSVLSAACLNGQDWAREKVEQSPRHGEWVKIKIGEREVESFVIFPEVADRAQAVVVIHEIFGLTDWVRGVGDDLAAAGYIAVCPDLLSGAGPNGGGTSSFEKVEDARRAIGALDPDQITSDLNGAVDYAAGLAACNGQVAVMGFCWGGSQAFRFATNNEKILVALPFYGSGPTEPKAIAKISAPVHGFYGGNDARVNATIPQSEALMREAEKSYTVHLYDGAGHGFMRAGEAPDASDPNRSARKQAWEKVLEILKGISQTGDGR